MKPIELKVSGGVRNDISEERYTRSDLSNAVNVEIDDTGKMWRRLGVSDPIALGVMHSLYSRGGHSYVVKDGVLQHINPDLTLTPMMAVSDRVRYQHVLHTVYASDGVSSWQLDGHEHKQWGIEPPNQPNYSIGVGDLKAGTYLITTTFVRNGGEESGAAAYMSITVPDNSSLTFELLDSYDPTVVLKRVYVSDINGEMPYFVGEIDASGRLFTLAALPALVFPCMTQLMQAAPSGDVIGLYRGRLYVGKNNILWYSQPYRFGLFRPMENYLGFATTVNTFAPVSDGIFVGSDEETVFLSGDDPADFTLTQKANYGTIKGTEYHVPNIYLREDDSGEAPIWMSKRGVCVGGNGGAYRNLTGERYILPEGVSSGASLLKVRGGTPQLITSLFD